jgi:hypothetical protein
MYVEFQFDNYLDLMGLRLRIDRWQRRYRIPITQKTVKYRHRIGMDHEENFTIFFLTWDGPAYQIVSNRNH